MEQTTNFETQNLDQNLTPVTPPKNIFKILFFILLALVLVITGVLITLLITKNKKLALIEKTEIKTFITSTETTKEETNILKISDIQMDLPIGWTVSSVSEKQAKILTDYKPYQVYLLLNFEKNSFRETSLCEYSRSISTKYGKVCSVDGSGFFTEALINNNRYYFVWDIESNQKPPADLDYPWVPDTNITSEILLDITETIRPSEILEISHNWKKYNDPNYKYSINYPDLWNIKQVSNSQLCLFSNDTYETLCSVNIVITPFKEYFANYNDHVDTSSFDQLVIQSIESDYSDDSYEKIDINGNIGYIVKRQDSYTTLLYVNNYIYEITFEDLSKPNKIYIQVLKTLKFN